MGHFVNVHKLEQPEFRRNSEEKAVKEAEWNGWKNAVKEKKDKKKEKKKKKKYVKQQV